MKGMHLNLDSCHQYWYPEGWKQDPYGLGIDLTEDNLGVEAEEDLVQIYGTPIEGAAA